MTETRKQVLQATKEELSHLSFTDGRRYVVIGIMHKMFEGCNEDETEKGMIELASDLQEFGMTLCCWPGRYDLLCAEERER